MISSTLLHFTAAIIILILAQVFRRSNAATTPPRYWFTAPTIGPDNIFTGNRILSHDVHGRFPDNVETFDVELPSNIEWIVATENPSSGGGPPQFVVATEDGSAYIISERTLRQLNYPTLSSGDVDDDAHPKRPPLVVTYHDETVAAVRITQIVEFPPSANLSSLSHPLPVFPCAAAEESVRILDHSLCGIFVYIDTFGDIILYNSYHDEKIGRISNVNALPDARLIMSPTNVLNTALSANYSKLLAVYGGATSFTHCVLGDCLEGSTLLLIQVTHNDEDDAYSITLEREITLPSGDVFEGLSPLFIDDGNVIVTTVANSGNGAKLRSYDVFCGDIISESSSIGWGWRHMLFYNSFGLSNSSDEDDEDALSYYLVEVLTPHVRKQLQFVDITAGGTMELKASTSKYTTHAIGWRYLDTAISGDLNGDGINEAILLDENLQNLVSFQLSNNNDGSGISLEEVWSVPLAGKLTSNIAAVSFDDEVGGETNRGVALAAASGSTLRIWISSSRATADINGGASPQVTTSIASTSATSDAASSAVTSIATLVAASATAIDSSADTSSSTSSSIPEPLTTTHASISAATSATTSKLSDTTSPTTTITTTTATTMNSWNDGIASTSASNDETKAAPKNCGAQPNLAYGLGGDTFAWIWIFKIMMPCVCGLLVFVGIV